MDIQLKRGTSADLLFVNPVLAAGEICVETNTNKFKIGDGTTAWNALPYAAVLDAPANGAAYVRENGAWVTVDNRIDGGEVSATDTRLTYYFNDATGDKQWYTIANWWLDSNFTYPATTLPSSVDNVVINADCDLSLYLLAESSYPTVHNLRVYGAYYSSILDQSGAVLFNSDSGVFNRLNVTGNLVVGDDTVTYGNSSSSGTAHINIGITLSPTSIATFFYNSRLDTQGSVIEGGSVIVNGGTTSNAIISSPLTLNWGYVYQCDIYGPFNYYGGRVDSCNISAATANTTIKLHPGFVTPGVEFYNVVLFAGNVEIYSTAASGFNFSNIFSAELAAAPINIDVYNNVSITSGVTGGTAINLIAGSPTPVHSGTITFHDTSRNEVVINGNAVFNDSARNAGTVNGTATFNNSACNVAGSGTATTFVPATPPACP